MKVVSVFKRKCAFLPLFLFNVSLITTSAGWKQRETLFVVPVCGVTSLSWQLDYVRGRKTLRKKNWIKDRNAGRQQSSTALTEPLFSTHCLRYATMHSKYNEQWLKQTEKNSFGPPFFSSFCCILSVALPLSFQFSSFNIHRPRLILFCSLILFSLSVYREGIN